MSRTSRALGHEVLRRVGDRIGRHGFRSKPASQSFYRAEQFGWSALHVAIIDGGVAIAATADVALRVDAVEDLVNAQDPAVSKAQARSTATVGSELGNLREGKQKRWTVASEADADHAAAGIVCDFEEAGLPYLSRYADLNRVLTTLSSHDPAAWLLSPLHDVRCKTVVALGVILRRADLQDLVERCRVFLAHREDPGLQGFEEFVHAHAADERPIQTTRS